jgi:hypothetical protein
VKSGSWQRKVIRGISRLEIYGRNIDVFHEVERVGDSILGMSGGYGRVNAVRR